ncbi:hypothetical protein GAMM_40198 [Gammaproteobacteria bacterium]
MKIVELNRRDISLVSGGLHAFIKESVIIIIPLLISVKIFVNTRISELQMQIDQLRNTTCRCNSSSIVNSDASAHVIKEDICCNAYQSYPEFISCSTEQMDV